MFHLDPKSKILIRSCVVFSEPEVHLRIKSVCLEIFTKLISIVSIEDGEQFSGRGGNGVVIVTALPPPQWETAGDRVAFARTKCICQNFIARNLLRWTNSDSFCSYGAHTKGTHHYETALIGIYPTR